MDELKFDKEIKRKLEESKDFYNPQALNAKEKIWSEVQKGKSNNRQKMLIRILSAACILLLLISSILSISLHRTNNLKTEIAEQNRVSQLKYNQISLQLNNKNSSISQNKIDTVFIKKTKIVQQPVIITKTLTDTVYLREVVYQYVNQKKDSVLPEKTIEIENVPSLSDKSPYNTEFRIINTKSEPKQNKQKLRIRLLNIRNEEAKAPSELSLKL